MHIIKCHSCYQTKILSGTAIEGRRSFALGGGLGPPNVENGFIFTGKGATRMSVVDLITVISFGLTCFIAGFQLGKSSQNAKK